jgi:hypothetical protein
LIDPIPAITDLHASIQALEARKARRNLRHFMPGIQSPFPFTDAWNEVNVEIALPMAPRLPTNNPVNKYTASDSELRGLKDSFTCLCSTSWSMHNADHSMLRINPSGMLSDHVITLLSIVENDTRMFLQSLEWALDDISTKSLDEFLMTRRLSEWRKLMSEFEKEVPAISIRLERFVHFFFGSDRDHSLPDEVDDIVQDVRENVERVKIKLNEAYTNLRVDMQFNESRRSMNETKTVTRLTELAFVFIPLSFCASLFSMSIRELDNSVPLWTFIVTALAMVTFAYGVRILVNSQLVANSTRRAFERFWAVTGLEPSDTDSVPMFTIIRFTVQEIWNSTKHTLSANAAGMVGIAGSLFLTTPLIIPIIFMWLSTNMGTGFNAVITLLLLLSVATVVLIVLGSRKFVGYRRTQAPSDSSV